MEYRLYIEENYHDNRDSDGNWDGTWETSYSYVIENDYFRDRGGTYLTKEEAMRAGERELNKLRDRK